MVAHAFFGHINAHMLQVKNMEDLKNFLSQLFRQSSDLIHVLPIKSSLGNPLQTLGVFYRFVGIARCLIAILLFDANTPERDVYKRQG